MIYVLDASVLLKWFLQEPDSAHALTYRERHREGAATIACPDLALYEVGNVLRYKRGVPETALADALSDLLRINLELFSPTETLLHRAARLAATMPVTFYDAV